MVDKHVEAFKARQKQMWKQVEQMSVETDIIPLDEDDYNGIIVNYKEEPAVEKRVIKTTVEQFEDLMKLFDEYKIDRIVCKDVPCRKEIRYNFSVDGPRNSIVYYSMWGDGVVDAWFGKSDSDSGGLALQGHIYRGGASKEQMRSILKLHKRFMGSGRLKILRRYNKR